MNRKERRKFAKTNKGEKTFRESFKQLVPETKPVDTSTAAFCWLHRITMENKDKPTDNDKKRIEAIRLEPFKIYNRDGSMLSMGRRCPKCGNTVWVKDVLSGPGEVISGYTEDRNIDTL